MISKVRTNLYRKKKDKYIKRNSFGPKREAKRTKTTEVKIQNKKPVLDINFNKTDDIK
jgi:hypothetical protein